ncbi:aminoglycoside O-phosphotransferase [Amycolatopsis mediterranei S699]|uniref:Aminoglycoside O-phosphotransferase n=2 Tax=Amycolatopsis mediterranei TaxID=33910 RepID=A0A0H3DA66_AMYMU|nr:aminoglycoside phosphotransferase family protein [Amycolatopsis mediterranei]ADJ46434.1 aminoglycoside O-phosphotransferase [Amycolatopsis mediterranei U32]AEK43230.1 aminoglycoside O-phosphotransferase [Amycolatopsis mediterranei S699]AFO78145.1 aminoglycoside O-phosphotransferase [Amycolatopsis mediterranei S699]AGT85273.1 aminoglycoside O-phosphotransferase [Amycolatopsis mediterranei RB]KDO06328.1 aminoglycoside phosphotransferase [Amycolatopsis mediterranei]
MAPLLIDAPARARLVDRFGAELAEPWCDALPDLVARLTARWGLTVREARPGNTGRTLLCTGPGGDLRVLKLTPDPEVARLEFTGLRAWAGCSRVVQVLDADLAANAILLEGLVPGTELAGHDIPWAQLGELLDQLHSVVRSGVDPRGAEPRGEFRRLAEGIEFIFDLSERRRRESAAAGLMPAGVLAKGRARALELATSGPVTLIHGDLHPANVLDAGPERGIVAIDPRPGLGDPSLDAVDFVFVPMAAGGTLDDGIAALAPHVTGFDAERVRAWCVAMAPLVALAPLRRGERTPFTDAVLELAR